MMQQQIDISNIRGDLAGGLTAGALSLPLALAFGVQSGMGAMAGLYGAIAIGVVAAWFGGTPSQVSGPTGPMTVVAAVIIANAMATSASLAAAMATIVATFLLAGIIQVLLGLLKVGQYIRYIPYPIVTGFISGIGMLLIALQVFPFLGHASPQNMTDIFAEMPSVLQQINFAAVGLATATIAVIYLSAKFSKMIPATFAALIILTITSTLLGLDVTVIGNVSIGMPAFKMADTGLLSQVALANIVLPAMVLAILGAIDSLLTSAVADNKTQTKHNSNQELIGQGLGNMAAAALGGLPGAGATMRTVVNIKAGGRTRISGMIHSIALLLILVVASNTMQLIPLPVLAGILITVGIELVNFKELKHFIYAPRIDAAIMSIVLGLTIFVDIFQAITIGVVLASILFMKKMSEMADDKAGGVAYQACFVGEQTWDDGVDLSVEMQQKVLIKHCTTPILAGFANELLMLPKSHPEVEIVILRMHKVTYMDQAGIYAFKELVTSLLDNNIRLLITGMQEQPMDMLKRVRMIPYLIPDENLCSDLQAAVQTLSFTNGVQHYPASVVKGYA
ncbi:MAG: STAS domain-containing protein [Methyloprofundus sp.]|nr:STAS domain-containing protein [Methyloprofundus sp.]